LKILNESFQQSAFFLQVQTQFFYLLITESETKALAYMHSPFITFLFEHCYTTKLKHALLAQDMSALIINIITNSDKA